MTIISTQLTHDRWQRPIDISRELEFRVTLESRLTLQSPFDSMNTVYEAANSTSSPHGYNAMDGKVLEVFVSLISLKMPNIDRMRRWQRVHAA